MDTQQTPPKTGTNGIAPPLSPPPTKAVRKHRRMPRWALWTGLAAVVGLGWVFWSRFQAGQNNAGTMITAQVTRGSLVEAVSATGSVTAQTGAEIKIGSQITGVIKNLYADVGSRVKAGQLIARLNLPDLEAQVASTQAALAAARTKLAQEEAGVGMTDTQVRMAVTQAQAGLGSAQAKTQSAQATATQTRVQTPTDIHKAETALASSRAALLTARAALVQTRAGAALQIATANHQTTQTQATAAYSALDLTRQQSLAAKGYVAQSVADQAKAMAAMNQALVSSAQENVLLVPSVAIQVGIHGATVTVITQKDRKQATTAMPVQTGGTDGINTEITKGLTEGQTIVVAGAAKSSGAGAARSSSPFRTPSRGGGRGG
jgi:HlyD family secretion protein